MTDVSIVAAMFDLLAVDRGQHKVGDTVTIKFFGQPEPEAVCIESIEFVEFDFLGATVETLVVNGREVGNFAGMDAFRA